ncbi:unnamed protein product [Aspergillus oryzae]|nr:unnamed protein product [Aspergillus oryzae]GMF94303.1 unnamed protein product [Aspergillus oryzae]
MTLSGYVVVVTGASKGIGKEIALRAATEGANIVINYLSDVKAANALVMHVGPERALAVQVDISSVEGANTLIDAAVSRFGKVDILIPNAAFVPDRNLQDVCEADFDRAFAVNVKGPCFLTQVSYHQAPCLPKAAMNQMVKVLARDLAGAGIRVNAISPGATSTDSFQKAVDEKKAKLVGQKSDYTRKNQKNATNSNSIFSINLKDINL